MALLLRLLMLFLSSWDALALMSSLRMTSGNPIAHDQVASMMQTDHSYSAQLRGCQVLGVDSSKKAAQDEAAKQGAIDAIARAMDLFPEDKDLVMTCTNTLSSLILFNHDNGLRAGQLGALNHTLHIYMKNMDDPMVMGLGGAIGAYFDYVDENRRIAAELGGIQAIIQNIRNNFHGKYSEWNYNPVKQSLFALSSGCWVNQDICAEEGFPELAVALMAEHGGEDKIAEETQQVTKALMTKSDAYRERLVELGITDSMVHVLQVNPHDRGAIDLTCQNFKMLVGPETAFGPSLVRAHMAFNKSIQAKALESGALETIMALVMGDQEMHHKEHGGFNFNVDLAYNFKKDCFGALHHLGQDNPEMLAAMAEAGLASTVLADIATMDPVHLQARPAACALLREMGAAGHDTVLDAGLSSCS